MALLLSGELTGYCLFAVVADEKIDGVHDEVGSGTVVDMSRSGLSEGQSGRSPDQLETGETVCSLK